MAPPGYWCKATRTDADCNSGDVCNPATLRCVSAAGQAGRRILAARGSGGQPTPKPQPKPKAHTPPQSQPPRRQGARTVTMLIGPTGAGKSTYAASLAASTGAVVVASDTYKSSRSRIDAAVRAALSGGHNVIVDATHPTAERRAQVSAIARAADATVKCVKFDVERSNAARRSSLPAPAKYIVAAKFFKNFNNVGGECDTVTVRTNANFGTLQQSLPSLPSQTPLPPQTSLPYLSLPQTSLLLPKPSLLLPKPSPMLALKYDPQQHRGAYYVSEKLDGIRAMFVDGTLYTRNGNVVAAPQWFLDAIPPGTYDGELFAGRGKFTTTMSIVMKSRPVDDEWKTIQYRIFDDFASTTKFSNTLTRLQRVLPPCSSSRYTPVCLERQHRVDSNHAVQMMFEDAHALGAEGLMLRANTPYKAGSRTKNVLKVKKAQDAEATILGFDIDTSNQMRSMKVRWDNGVVFKVGSGFSAQERVQWRAMFKIGDRVTVQYAELTAAGKARFPVFKAVRRNA